MPQQSEEHGAGLECLSVLLSLLVWADLRVAGLCLLRRRTEIDIRLREYSTLLSCLFFDEGVKSAWPILVCLKRKEMRLRQPPGRIWPQPRFQLHRAARRHTAHATGRGGPEQQPRVSRRPRGPLLKQTASTVTGAHLGSTWEPLALARPGPHWQADSRGRRAAAAAAARPLS